MRAAQGRAQSHAGAIGEIHDYNRCALNFCIRDFIFRQIKSERDRERESDSETSNEFSCKCEWNDYILDEFSSKSINVIIERPKYDCVLFFIVFMYLYWDEKIKKKYW